MQKNPLTEAYSKYRSILFSTFFFGFFANLLMFVGPLYMLQVYDRILSSRNETTLAMITIIAIGLLVSYGFLEFARSRMLVRAGLQFDDILADPLFKRVVRVELANPSSGGRTALSDADRIRDFIAGQGILSFFDAPWTPLFLFLCFQFHPYIGMVATGGAAIIFTLALLNELMTKSSLQAANVAGARAGQFASATLQNAEVIRAMGMVDALSDRWMRHRDDMLLAQARASDRAGAVLSITKFVRMSLQIAILGVGALLAMHQQISPGIMIAASIIMGRALAPVEQAVGQWKQFVAARQAHSRLNQLFHEMPEELPRTRLPAPRGDLAAESLTATAPGTREIVLRGVTFKINAGEMLAIVGPSGSGKSSLIRNIVGVSDMAGGTVRLDGTELRHWGPEQLGQYIGYLSQEIRLFSGTVAENIARFRDGADDAEIVRAAQMAGAHEMISGLRDGYGTSVGEGGFDLSGGQRQRIGLARAVFGKPRLIALDEPNSNLDTAGETALAECLRQLKDEGTTVVVVTHKTNLLSLTDKTLVLSNGMVRQFSPTNEILEAQRTRAKPRLLSSANP